MRSSVLRIARLGEGVARGGPVRAVQISSSKFPSLHQSAAVAPGQVGPGVGQYQDPFKLTQEDLKTMVRDIHEELDTEIRGQDSELREMAKYYFDGNGKAIRPVIALCLGHAFNHHTGAGEDVVRNQRRVAIISEMIHTASLVHDDVVDHAETRRGKVSVNAKWNPQKSTMCGNYIVGVCSRIMAEIAEPRVIMVLSQVSCH